MTGTYKKYTEHIDTNKFNEKVAFAEEVSARV